MSDKSFKIELKTPLTATLLHKAVGAAKGSGKAGTDIIGSINIEKLEEIAKIKLADLNCEAMKSIKFDYLSCRPLLPPNCKFFFAFMHERFI